MSVDRNIIDLFIMLLHYTQHDVIVFIIKKVKGKVVPVLNWGSGGIAPRILDLGTRWR